MTDPRVLRDVAVDVAVEAAALLVSGFDRTRIAVESKSTPTDMVTEMDRASERLIVERLLAIRPDDGILGEEGTDVAGTTGVRWVIDPLDGTTNYLYRHPGWNVSIGAEIDGEPMAGAVAVPSLSEVFAAARGFGATRNGRPIRIGEPAPLDQALVGTGFSYDATLRIAQVEVLGGLIDRIRDIRRGGAAAADLCSVACGRLDAYYEVGLAPWDRVAATAIAAEAGAVVEVIDLGPSIGRDLTVAAHPARLDELLTLLGTAGLLD